MTVGTPTLRGMLERDWVSLSDPGEPHDRYLFDVSFLLSTYTCIYGRGCPGTGTEPSAVAGCCALGAHYVDADDRRRVEAMVDELGPAGMQLHVEARRRGVTARVPGGDFRTRVVRGACIFLNREDWPAGPGCALHQHAVARGVHPMDHKPEVCWLVPLRREVHRGVGDDGLAVWTTTITSYDRGAWGIGGADFGWWCTDAAEAHVGDGCVYETMEAELRAMTSDAVYDELAGYLRDRRRRARRPLPLAVR